MGCSHTNSVQTAENPNNNLPTEPSKEIENPIKARETLILQEERIDTKNPIEKIDNELNLLKPKDILLKKNNPSKNYLKNSNNNNNANKNPLKPYILTQIEEGTISCVHIIINACSFLTEYMMPLWVKEDQYIKFKVKGKWRIDKMYKYTDSSGMPSSVTLGFNYGALVGRIGDGEQFAIKNNSTYPAINAGPLFLKMNLPKNMKVNPEGCLNLHVYDALYMPVEVINRKLGWNENICSYKNDNVTQLEKDLTATFNNLRMNPKIFYEKNIEGSQNVIWTKDFLMKENCIDRDGFIMNDGCYNLLNNFFMKQNVKEYEKIIAQSGAAGFLCKLDESLTLFLKQTLIYPFHLYLKLTKKTSPIDICIQYLLDQKCRTLIYTQEIWSLSIKILNNVNGEQNLIVVGFFKDILKKSKKKRKKKKKEQAEG